MTRAALPQLLGTVLLAYTYRAFSQQATCAKHLGRPAGVCICALLAYVADNPAVVHQHTLFSSAAMI